MASLRPLDETKIPSLELEKPEPSTLPAYLRLGVLNGLLIGMAISLGFWLTKVYTLAKLPTAVGIDLGGVLGSSFLIIVLCIAISWLTSRVNKGWLTVIVWLFGGALITMMLGYIPTYGRNLAAWLMDGRFAGVYVYLVPQSNEWWSFVVAGFLLVFILFILALLQSVRLERAFNDLRADGKLSASAFYILLLPALFAGLGAYAMPDHLSSAPREALVFAQHGIQFVQNFEGSSDELFEVARETGFNYSALKGVREQLTGPYTLMVGEVDANAAQVAIIAHFENGAWIDCRVNAFVGHANYLSFCADASRPYTEGFASLITGEPLPENCSRCLPDADPAWQNWLQERVAHFNGVLQFERLAQQGNAVWMRASAADGTYAIDCLFTGITAVQLQECKEVNE